jgi:hypothetical protein
MHSILDLVASLKRIVVVNVGDLSTVVSTFSTSSMDLLYLVHEAVLVRIVWEGPKPIKRWRHRNSAIEYVRLLNTELSGQPASIGT